MKVAQWSQQKHTMGYCVNSLQVMEGREGGESKEKRIENS